MLWRRLPSAVGVETDMPRSYFITYCAPRLLRCGSPQNPQIPLYSAVLGSSRALHTARSLRL